MIRAWYKSTAPLLPTNCILFYIKHYYYFILYFYSALHSLLSDTLLYCFMLNIILCYVILNTIIVAPGMPVTTNIGSGQSNVQSGNQSRYAQV